MKLVDNGKKNIPKEWIHDPTLHDVSYETVAIHLAEKTIVPPKEWQHDPALTDKSGKTVCDYLISENIKVPNNWLVFTKEIVM